MPCSERSHHRVVLAVLSAVALLVVALVGCSDDEPTAATNTTTTSASSSTKSTSSTATTDRTSTSTSSTIPAPATAPGTTPEQEVIDRYIAYWNARFEANSGTPDPNHPARAQFATGAQFDAVVEETQSNLDEGLAIRQADDPHDFQGDGGRARGRPGCRAGVRRLLMMSSTDESSVRS